MPQFAIPFPYTTLLDKIIKRQEDCIWQIMIEKGLLTIVLEGMVEERKEEIKVA